VFQGSLVVTQFAPFETVDPPQGIKDYLAHIEAAGGKKGEISLAGWQNAELFVEGLKAAGPDFSRAKVISAINQMTDWNANGINPGIDWTIAHTKDSDVGCVAVVKIDNSKFVPQFSDPGKPFFCLDRTQATLPDKAPTKA
jgi:hypothetical protein